MSAPQASGAKSLKKQEYFAKLKDLVSTYPQIIIVEADNVGSRQMAEVRFALRGRGTVLMGKNTMIRTCLRQKVEEMPQIQALIDLVKDNVGMIFCKDDPSAIRKTILNFKVPAPAKQGALAPASVVVPAGGTNMDPGQTSFFQALGIATKIVKGQIEIQSDVPLIKEGDRVTASQAVLLNKLNIKPFSYGLKPTIVYDDGATYPANVLDISSEDITAALKQAIASCAAASLGCSYPTKPSVAHSIINAFRECAGVAFACDYEFPQMAALKDAMANPSSAAAAAPVNAAAPAAAVEEEKEEEEEEDDMGFSLFD